jgi:predicted Na+-dependent transporter
MFAVGINLNYSDFVSAFKRPSVLAIGYIGQYVLKPLLGVLFASIAVSQLHLPEAIGNNISI